MSYFRGDPYIWTGGDNDLHIWRRHPDASCSDRKEWPGSVVLTQKVFDQLAVMRVAELVQEGRVHEVIAEAIKEQNGNGGCQALVDGYLFGKRKKNTGKE